MIFKGKEINTGAIFTNSKCLGCNKCVIGCPSFGANVLAAQDDGEKIYVDQDKCIMCGRCVINCPNGAREYADDTAKLLQDLEAFRAGKRKRPISVVVSPGFKASYPDRFLSVLGWLKGRGVEHIYSSSVGEEISIWAHVKYMQMSGGKGMISQPCQAVVSAVETMYPNLIDKLVPVHSPLMCTAIYMRDYLHLESDIAYISPCFASKADIMRPGNRRYVQYSVSFPALLKEAFRSNNESFAAGNTGADFSDELLPHAGVLSQGLEYYMEDFDSGFIFSLSGDRYVYPALQRLSEGRQAEEHMPLLSDFRNCAFGCSYGTATEYHNPGDAQIPYYDSVASKRFSLQNPNSVSPQERREELCRRFESLDLNHFLTKYTDRSIPPPQFKASEINGVLHKMLKFSKSEQNVDCGLCGMGTCRKMAEAVLLGHSNIVRCPEYSRKMLQVLHSRNEARLRKAEQANSNALDGSEVGRLDQLTGLESRYSMELRLEAALEKAQREGGEVFVFNIDLDDFMAINDSYGHNYGNAMLIEFSRYLVQAFGDLCSVYRVGGDKFMLLAEGIDSQTAKYISEALLIKGQQPWDIMGARIYCTSSIGVAAFGEDCDEVRSVAKNAEIATSAAKAQGKNICIFYSSEIGRDTGGQSDIIRRMRNDINNGFRGFDVYFQPWLTCEGELVGAEALMRWKDERGRYISPAEFIPIAESSGLIVPIGEFILRRAAQKCIEANERLPYFTISVNMSPKQFSRSDIFETVLDIFESEGVNKSNMVLEITESLGFDNIDRQSELLQKFSDAGIKIALDDFGTGYSSLSYLNKLPLDIVKMDRSFIRELESDNYSKFMLMSMTDLMHKMGRRVVVEGVETRSQLDLCESFCVDIIQGYLFFKPLNGIQMSQLITIS